MKNLIARQLANDFQCRLHDRLSAMSREELLSELYRDHLTGAYNRRAFDESESACLAIVDADSLKWVNDHEGHVAGDMLLRELANGLQAEFGAEAVFRLGGDEFAVRGSCSAAIAAGLGRVRVRIATGFSFGIAAELPEADAALREDKRARTLRGERAARGERRLMTA